MSAGPDTAIRAEIVVRTRAVLFAAIVLSVTLAGVPSCNTQQRSVDHRGAPESAVNQAIDDPGSEEPGMLLASSPFPTVDVRISRANAYATRITYRSTSGLDGSATAVTGAVFVPRAEPPAGGWPVVAYAHAGIGIIEKCAPSMYPDLLGSGSQVERLLDQGYLVVMTDYQGLGSKGPHPFLEPTTLGYNVIDSVRAARSLVPEAGTRWAAWGGSEGGEAAWAAAELAPSYGQGLDMVGAVALAPTANLSAMPQAAFDRELESRRPPGTRPGYEQLALMLKIVNAAAWMNPDVVRDDYLRGFARQYDDVLLECEGAQLYVRNGMFGQVTADDVAPRSQEAADRLTDVLRTWSVPGPWAPTPVPILVVVGLFDAVIWPDWTMGAARLACERGEQISWMSRLAEGHDNLDIRPSFKWLAERFLGLPIEGACAITDGAP
jgi:pimeloyl-ACP methyl ester carboxylesterase